MGSIVFFVSSLIALAASAGTAQADDKKAADQGEPAHVKVFTFSGDTIEGKQLGPDGSVVDVRGTARSPSLIRIRTNFIPELIKSTDEL